MSITENANRSARRDLLDAVWRIASSSNARLVLVGMVALSLLLGSLFPQLPASMAGDTVAADRWLAATASGYGLWAASLRALGLFEIGRAAWFHLLLALVSWHLLLCTAQTAKHAWSVLASRSLPWPQTGTPATASAPIASSLSEALSIVRSRLSSEGLRVIVEGQTHEHVTGARVYADRWRLGVLGPSLSGIGALLLLVGVLLNAVLGWHTGDIPLAPGDEIELKQAAGLSLHLESTALPDQDGRVTLSMPGLSRTESLGVCRPVCFGGICVRQASTGPALRLSATDPSDQPLLLQAGDSDADRELTLLFDQPQAERLFTVPAADLALRVVSVAPGSSPRDAAATFLLQAYQLGSSDPVLEATIREPDVAHIGATRLSLAPQSYAVLQAYGLPGLSVLAIGAVLLLIGIALPVVRPGLQVWVELLPERRLVRALLAAEVNGAGVDPQFEVNRLAKAMGGDDVQFD